MHVGSWFIFGSDMRTGPEIIKTYLGNSSLKYLHIQGLRPIHYAVWQRYTEAVRLLLVRGCDVNSTDDCGYSPLHLAAEHGYTEMMKVSEPIILFCQLFLNPLSLNKLRNHTKNKIVMRQT